MKIVQVTKKSIRTLRIMLSGIFLVAGINHILFPAHVAKRLVSSFVYEEFMFFMNAEILVLFTGAGLLTGGILLLINKFPKYAAMLLLMLLIPITVSVQLQGWETSGPLFKNVAIAGALLFFIMNDFETIKLVKNEV